MTCLLNNTSYELNFAGTNLTGATKKGQIARCELLSAFISCQLVGGCRPSMGHDELRQHRLAVGINSCPHTQLQLQGCAALANLNTSSWVHAGNLSGNWLALSPALVSVDLSGTKLTGDLPAALAGWDIQTLRLNGSGLSGSIPAGKPCCAAAGCCMRICCLPSGAWV